MASVSTIFEKSIKEIEAGRWICGDLCHLAYDEKKGDVSPKKHMACAVGMVALYGGHTVDSTVTLKNGQVVQIKTALYPESETIKKAPPRVRTALEYLVRAIPNKEFEINEQYPVINVGGYDEFDYENPTVLTKKNLSEWTLSNLSAAVVSYNDGDIANKKVPSKSALAWFKRAYKLYLKDNEKFVVTPKGTKMLQDTMVQESNTLTFA